MTISYSYRCVYVYWHVINQILRWDDGDMINRKVVLVHKKETAQSNRVQREKPFPPAGLQFSYYIIQLNEEISASNIVFWKAGFNFTSHICRMKKSFT